MAEYIAVQLIAELLYIQSAALNGRPLTRTWIGHEEILKGGTLRLEMSKTPNLQRGTDISDRPYSFSR